VALFAKENPVKKLESLRSAPIQDDNLHLACIKGALDYLGMDISAPWLAGATGHAFVIHIEEGVCLSSVWSAMADSYRTGEMARLGQNVGYELDYRQVEGGEDGLPGRRQLWTDMCRAIDAGHPCYMYHNFCYQMIGGYDGDGIYFAEDSFPWSNAGQGPVSVLEHGGFDMAIVRPGQPAPDAETVKAGLQFALSHPDDSPRYRGLAAYDRWIETIRSGEAGGTWRSIRAWHTCRSLAAEFFPEARERLGTGAGGLFDEASEHYLIAARSLEPIAEKCAAGDFDVADQTARAEAVDHLLSAQAADLQGIGVLEKLVAAL